MPSISANRPFVDERFPVLGFTVRTGMTPSWFEVALMTQETVPPGERSPTNFWSSRSLGALTAPRGEAVFLVPAEVMARFAGSERLFYRLAVSSNPDMSNAQVVPAPAGRVASVSLAKTFTGQSRRMLISNRPSGSPGRNRTYTDAGQNGLSWAGDQPVPGETKPAPANGSAPTAAPHNGSAPVAGASAFDAGYDDGFGTFPAARTDERGSGYVNWPRTPQAGTHSRPFSNDADHGPGIEGPIPDAPSHSSGLARAAATQSPEYPNASRFVPADPGNYRHRTDDRTISRIVIHITDGGPNINGVISWFRNPAARVSSHYIVGQDGEVVQMVAHRDVAWHAGSANGNSIGIEHVANTRGLNPTMAEYESSAALVAWLCDMYGIAREHVTVWAEGSTGIQGHAEADSQTTHRACPNAVWDWDTYMGLIQAAGQSTSQGFSRAMTRNERRSARPFAQVTPEDAGAAGQFLREFQDRRARWSAGVSDTTIYPFSAICHLRITGSDGKTYTGTAFYIGPNKLLTAGHNLKDTDNWTAASISITPGKNGSAQAGAPFTVSPSDWVTHPNYVPGNQDFDMGVILVNRPPPNGWFFDILEELLQSMPSPIIVCGYSAATVDSDKQHLDGDMVRTVHDETLEYNLQTEGGASGSPVFYVWAREDDELRQSVLEHRVVGVHVSSYSSTLNRSSRLTEAKINWIYAVARDSAGAAATFGFARAAALSRGRTRALDDPARPPAEQAAIIEIGSAIAGAVMTRVLDNEGDVQWELEQLNGLKHVQDNPVNAGTGAYHDATPLRISGFKVWNLTGDEIWAEFEIRWQYNGRSLGNIEISPARTDDAVGMGLRVKAHIGNDAKTYTAPGAPATFAAVHITFIFVFTRVIGADKIGRADIVLYGNGQHSEKYEWTQH